MKHGVDRTHAVAAHLNCWWWMVIHYRSDRGRSSLRGLWEPHSHGFIKVPRTCNGPDSSPTWQRNCPHASYKVLLMTSPGLRDGHLTPASTAAQCINIQSMPWRHALPLISNMCQNRRTCCVASEMFMTRSLNVTPKTTEQHLIARSDKSVACVTNNIYIFIHHQDGSTIYIRRLNKIYNLTKKQHMKQSSPNAYAMRYTNRLAWEEKYIDSR